MLSRRRARFALFAAAAGLVSSVAVAVPLAAPAAASGSPIDGSYVFNGNGWTGSLTITAAETGTPTVVMSYDQTGSSQTLTGSWQAANGVLTVNRPLSSTVSQLYTLYLGNHHPSQPVLAGFFTQSDHPGQRYGAYADYFVPIGGLRTIESIPMVPASGPIDFGSWAVDANGSDGGMMIWPSPCDFVGDDIVFNEIGAKEKISSYQFDTSTNTMSFILTLTTGVTQSYTLYEGTNTTTNTMVGGYYTESDQPGVVSPAYGQLTNDTGIGC